VSMWTLLEWLRSVCVCVCEGVRVCVQVCLCESDNVGIILCV